MGFLKAINVSTYLLNVKLFKNQCNFHFDLLLNTRFKCKIYVVTKIYMTNCDNLNVAQNKYKCITNRQNINFSHDKVFVKKGHQINGGEIINV